MRRLGKQSIVYFNGLVAGREGCADAHCGEQEQLWSPLCTVGWDCGCGGRYCDVERCREIWTARHDLADGQVSGYAFVDCVYVRYVMSVPEVVVGRKNSTGITIFLQQQG